MWLYLGTSKQTTCYTFLDKLHKKIILALYCMYADIAQLVEYKLPKLGVAGSNPVVRSICGTDDFHDDENRLP